MDDIRIDPELRALIPPLSDVQRTQLELSLLDEGCHEPLVVWAGHRVLLDGHHRHEICRRYGLAFSVREIDLPDRRAAELWILWNQLDTRDLAPYGRAELALELEKRWGEEVGKVLPEDRPETVAERSAESPRAVPPTDRDLAGIPGASRPMIHRAAVLAEKAPEPVKQALRQGDTSIDVEFGNLEWRAAETTLEVTELGQTVLGAVATAVGIEIALVSLGADLLGLGSGGFPGVHWKQLLGIAVGVAIAAGGLALLTTAIKTEISELIRTSFAAAGAAVGLEIALVSLDADALGLGSTPGIHWQQWMGMTAGLVIGVCGIALLRRRIRVKLSAPWRGAIGAATTAVGIQIMLLSLGADVLGVGSSPGIQWQQWMGAAGGLTVVVSGILLMRSRFRI